MYAPIESPPHDVANRGRWQVVLETALVFAIFFFQGAWPVPDLNEPYYLGKAIHFWDPGWVRGDFFLQSADSHTVFYYSLGWLALFLEPLAMAWVCRVILWGLLAWGWQRLSVAVVPRAWMSVLTAGLFVCLQDRCQMAGEWVVGGVEGKVVAYALVFFGLEAILRGRWNRAWLLWGLGAAFHVLVGGWSVVAGGVAWLVSGKGRAPLRSMLPGLAGGFLLALAGLWPALALDRGVDASTAHRAHYLYVFERLGHHLDPSQFPAEYVLRFSLLAAVYGLCTWYGPVDRTSRRLQGFVAGAMAIALAGGLIRILALEQPVLAADLLRFYWFRLVDVVLPLGMALWVGGQIDRQWSRVVEPNAAEGLRTAEARLHGPSRPKAAWLWLGGALLVCVLHVGGYAIARAIPMAPRTVGALRWVDWRRACAWIEASKEIPAEARFLTPLDSRTFKWYARRPEVAVWKEPPQDAQSLVEWWDRLRTIHATGSRQPGNLWHDNLAELGADRLVQLGRQYQAGFALIERTRRPVTLPIVYKNRSYVVYRLP